MELLPELAEALESVREMVHVLEQVLELTLTLILVVALTLGLMGCSSWAEFRNSAYICSTSEIDFRCSTGDGGRTAGGDKMPKKSALF
jgi:hypothetical protein